MCEHQACHEHARYCDGPYKDIDGVERDCGLPTCHAHVAECEGKTQCD